jgi:SAM-dependent methyltransferase
VVLLFGQRRVNLRLALRSRPVVASSDRVRVIGAITIAIGGCVTSSEVVHSEGPFVRLDVVRAIADARCVSDDYRTLNRASWDERASAHAASADYGFSRFASDPRHLSEVVTFDLPRLGSVRGLRGIHLQCHIGTDTVSLARLGARMSGLDFSPAALIEARRLADLLGAEVDFHEADVYLAPEVLGRGLFDLVFTGIGALCWLPDVRRWAEVVAALLRPGGRLFLREGHPMLLSLAEVGSDGRLVVEDPYFERTEPTVIEQSGTYVETQAVFSRNLTHQWNHGLGEVVTALLDQSMELTALTEHDSAPWEALPGHMDRLPSGEWRLRDRAFRLPHTYTLQAVKRRRAQALGDSR